MRKGARELDLDPQRRALPMIPGGFGAAWRTAKREVVQIANCALAIGFSTLSYLPAADPHPAADARRPSEWAVAQMNPKLHNFFCVTPALYRCAQPDAAGMQAIAALGIVTVVNLRAFHHDRDELMGTNLLSEELSIKTWHIEDEDVIRVLRICCDPAKQPVLIHCQYGADRTGVMCCLYRVVVQDWDKKAAIREMTDGGYGFWPHWTNIIHYVEEVDVTRLKAAIRVP